MTDGQYGINPTNQMPAVHQALAAERRVVADLPENQRAYCRVCGKRKRRVPTGKWAGYYVCDDPHYLPVLPAPLPPLPEPEIAPTDTYAAWREMQDDHIRQFLEAADYKCIGNDYDPPKPWRD